MEINVNKIIISNDEIVPKVLTAVMFSQIDRTPEVFQLQERYVYDYEFELIVYSTGSMIIDDKNYIMQKGDILFRRPGQYTQGTMPYISYVVCVDMLSNTGKNSSDYYIYNEQEYQNYYINPILERIPTLYHSLNMEKSTYIFDSILKEFINPSPVSELSQRANILNLICDLYQDAIDPFINSPIPLSPYMASLKDVIEYIENNLENKMVLRDFSRIANLSPSHFHRVFTKTVGVTPHEFILKCKLDKAKEFLTKSSLSVSEISTKCGFESSPYFCYVFKKQTGVTPLEFRNKFNYI